MLLKASKTTELSERRPQLHGALSSEAVRGMPGVKNESAGKTGDGMRGDEVFSERCSIWLDNDPVLLYIES